MPFTNKIQLGTYTEDGLRSGPVYPYKYDSTNKGLVSANVTASDYGRFGRGVLYSSITPYTFTPLDMGWDLFTNTGPDVCSYQSVLTNGYLSLKTNNAANGISLNTSKAVPATYKVNKEGKGYIQFDYPRVPFIFLQGPNDTVGNVPVTIFGTDGYGYPIQMTYQVGASTGSAFFLTFPERHGAYSAPMKSFDTITDVYVNGAFPSNDYRIGVGSSNIFGLPYKLKNQGDVVSFSCESPDPANIPPYSLLSLSGSVTLVNGFGSIHIPALYTLPGLSQPGNQGLSLTYFTPNNTAPTNAGFLSTTVPNDEARIDIYSSNEDDQNTLLWTLSGGGYKLFQCGDESTPSTTSGDPRGLVRLPSILDQNFGDPVWSSELYSRPNGQLEASVSYYVRGANAFINQVARSGSLIGEVPNPNFNQLVSPSELMPEDLYGVAPYYTGVPG